MVELALLHAYMFESDYYTNDVSQAAYSVYGNETFRTFFRILSIVLRIPQKHP